MNELCIHNKYNNMVNYCLITFNAELMGPVLLSSAAALALIKAIQGILMILTLPSRSTKVKVILLNIQK